MLVARPADDVAAALLAQLSSPRKTEDDLSRDLCLDTTSCSRLYALLRLGTCPQLEEDANTNSQGIAQTPKDLPSPLGQAVFVWSNHWRSSERSSVSSSRSMASSPYLVLIRSDC